MRCTSTFSVPATDISATRPNHSPFAVNPDLIERIHANPDTTPPVDDWRLAQPRRARHRDRLTQCWY
ncbi:MAG TPA: flagellar FlbD family protein [Diaminobutyricibacter sp.]